MSQLVSFLGGCLAIVPQEKTEIPREIRQKNWGRKMEAGKLTKKMKESGCHWLCALPVFFCGWNFAHRTGVGYHEWPRPALKVGFGASKCGIFCGNF
jgi:hypothetical protein